MKRLFTLLVASLAVALATSTSEASARELHIVPAPTYIDLDSESSYTVTPKTTIVVEDDAWNAADRFAEDLDEMLGMLADLAEAAPCEGGADALTTASLRADTVGASLAREDALAGAPVRCGEYIAVPRVVE